MNVEERSRYQFICPCCGEKGIEEQGISDVCIYCGWEEDPVQEADPEYCGGANHMSLNEARAAYKDGKKIY